MALDYTENVAAGVWALATKWNELYDAGVLVNGGNAADPVNWYFTLWAYNTGLNPASAGSPWGLGWTNNPRQSELPAQPQPVPLPAGAGWGVRR